ncbi:hypothetical protein BF49_3246 [Bradyrhizobium sp.]|nr:hypothetical protein BF49_3246 [Bradyrhizobium sp.]
MLRPGNDLKSSCLRRRSTFSVETVWRFRTALEGPRRWNSDRCGSVREDDRTLRRNQASWAPRKCERRPDASRACERSAIQSRKNQEACE